MLSRGLVVVLFALMANGQVVNVWLTTDDRKSLMQAQQPVSFIAGGDASQPAIFIDEKQTHQSIEGFGASFTDSSAYLMNQKIPKATLNGVMLSLFDHAQGIGLSFVRNPMGASDLTRSQYSYDDLPKGSTDPSLSSFSIAHDQTDILPLIKQAQAINGNLKLMATPWSPPGWMKTSDSVIGGALLPAFAPSLAAYFVKYIQAYESAGVHVDYVSVQNEPGLTPADYPGMAMTGADQTSFLKDNLLPALAASGITTKVLVYDFNWDNTSFPQIVLADPALANSPQIAGIAWHWYAGPPGAMTTLQNLYPAKGNYVTEASGGTWISDEVRTDFETITHSMRNSSRSFVKWGMALDQHRGPNTGGCSTCTPLITVNDPTGEVTYTIDYYTLGHFSKFVLPGAVRVYSNNIEGVVNAVFVNPDNSRALVAYNDSTSDRTFQVLWNGGSFAYTLPALAGATFTWKPGPLPRFPGLAMGPSRIGLPRNPAPRYAFDAKAFPIQASSYTAISNLQSESCTDTNGGYDLGFAADGSWAEFRRLNFGTGAGSVDVRVASGGSGGTLEFHVNSPIGPLIAQAQVPVTGGWQTWTTVTAPVSSASGVRSLYIVFRAANLSNGIGNLNWFRFR